MNIEESLPAERVQHALLESLVAGNVDGIFAFDLNLCSTVWNPGMERLTGVASKDAVGRPVLDLFPIFKKQGDDQHIENTLQGKSIIAKESHYPLNEMGHDGTFESHFFPLRDDSGVIIGGSVHIREIMGRQVTEHLQAELLIRDPLTKLYNRKYFNQQLQHQINSARRLNYPIAVLFCDINNFKSLNDEQGHQVGDAVLVEVAEAIRKTTRQSDLVFRLGGDEFVVLLRVKSNEEPIAFSLRIRAAALEVGYRFKWVLNLNIGASLFPEHGRDAEQLVRLATRALSIAKKRADHLQVGVEAYHLDSSSVAVAFQPIVDVFENKVLGQEALGRDGEGKLSIYHLFKKYEAVGRLNGLKDICFRKQIDTAVRVGLERLFINVDFKLLDRIGMIEKPASMDVVLEISEQEVLENVDEHILVTEKWREAGFKFAIDDFGAGFISLPFIARLNPDYVKLDRMTVLQAVASQKFRDFLWGVIGGLTHYTKEGIIAEGVETEDELEIVKKMGISLVQGYLLGRPEIVSET